MAGQLQRAQATLQELVDVSVSLHHFEDAAFYTYQQALAALQVCFVMHFACTELLLVMLDECVW